MGSVSGEVTGGNRQFREECLIVRIREATPQDAAAIAEVHVASWKTTYAGIVPDGHLERLDAGDRARRWEERLREHSSTTLVAEDDAGIFGFVNGGTPLHPVPGYEGELCAMYLLRSHQRQGAGSELVRHFAERLSRDGLRTLVVWVLAENPACEFYRRLGGAMVGEQMIEIGGKLLREIAFGWPDIRVLYTER